MVKRLAGRLHPHIAHVPRCVNGKLKRPSVCSAITGDGDWLWAAGVRDVGGRPAGRSELPIDANTVGNGTGDGEGDGLLGGPHSVLLPA